LASRACLVGGDHVFAAAQRFYDELARGRVAADKLDHYVDGIAVDGVRRILGEYAVGNPQKLTP